MIREYTKTDKLNQRKGISVQLRLDKLTHDKLLVLANGESKSAVIRRAIREMFTRENKDE